MKVEQKVVANSTKTAKITNLKTSGNLEVIKVDEKHQTKRLAGVEFKIKNSSGNYIIVNGMKGENNKVIRKRNSNFNEIY